MVTEFEATPHAHGVEESDRFEAVHGEMVQHVVVSGSFGDSECVGNEEVLHCIEVLVGGAPPGCTRPPEGDSVVCFGLAGRPPNHAAGARRGFTPACPHCVTFRPGCVESRDDVFGVYRRAEVGFEGSRGSCKTT